MKTRNIFSTALASVVALTMVLGAPTAADASNAGYRLGLNDQWTHIPIQSVADFELRAGTSSRLNSISPVDFEAGKVSTSAKVPVPFHHAAFDPSAEDFGAATWLEPKRHPAFSPIAPEAGRFSRSRWHIRWTLTLLGPSRGVHDYRWYPSDVS